MVFRDVHFIVFDLNGTLVAENYLEHDYVLESILKCRKRNQEGLTVKDLREVSKGKCTLNKVISNIYLTDNPETVTNEFYKIQASRIRFRRGANTLLKALYVKYNLILCSDTTGIAKYVVEKMKLSKYFTKILYSYNVGYLKSEPEFWSNLLSNFPKAKPAEFLVIGDNPRADIYIPKRLGMHTILIKNPIKQSLDYRELSSGLDEEKPEYNIRSLCELWTLLT